MGAEPAVATALFPDRLAEAVERKRSQLVVGLDPRLDLLPLELRGDAEITPDDDYSFADQLGAKYQADLRSRDHPGESRVKVTIHPTRINAVDMRG